MIIDFSKKTAFICGATSGIGLAVARQLAECGGSIILLGRSQKKLLFALKSLKSNSVQYHEIIEADLVNTNQIENIMNTLVKKHEQIDILVNNSSGPLPKNVLSCNTDDFQRVFNQHFLSVNIITKAVIDLMKKHKYGRVVNVLGTSIKEPIPGLGLSSIKAVTSVWAKSLSKEVGRYNITVNNILPGPTNTKELKDIIGIFSKNENLSETEYLKKICRQIDLGRIAKADEIANVITFICSEYASFVTGSNIFVDGGYTTSI